MTTATNGERRSGRFNFRTTRRQDALIRAAARLRGVSASQYLAESASKQAEIDLADRRAFTIPTKRMRAFLAALDRPVKVKPRLRRLLAEPSVLEGE